MKQRSDATLNNRVKLMLGKTTSSWFEAVNTPTVRSREVYFFDRLIFNRIIQIIKWTKVKRRITTFEYSDFYQSQTVISVCTIVANLGNYITSLNLITLFNLHIYDVLRLKN